MENKKNKNSLKVAFITILIVAIGGIFGTCYFYIHRSICNCEQRSSLVNFRDYAFLLNHDVIDYYHIGEYSVIDGVYLKDNKVYFSIKEDSIIDSMNLTENEKTKIKNLEKEELKILDDFNPLEVYKLPLDNVVLIDLKTIGQSASPIILMETIDGKVYSFLTDQTGPARYSFFNSNGDINIIEETKFKNIIKFGDYLSNKNNELYFYGIDIYGNIIYYLDE